jgi:hypothetical protein
MLILLRDLLARFIESGRGNGPDDTTATWRHD